MEANRLINKTTNVVSAQHRANGLEIPVSPALNTQSPSRTIITSTSTAASRAASVSSSPNRAAGSTGVDAAVANAGNPANLENSVNLGPEDPLKAFAALSEEDVTDAMISIAVEKANNAISPSFFRLAYSVHNDTNMIMVQVRDATTNEIIREIPPESRLDTLARIMEFAGLIFDGRG